MQLDSKKYIVPNGFLLLRGVLFSPRSVFNEINAGRFVMEIIVIFTIAASITLFKAFKQT